jgi:hypothetical protein
LKVFGHSRDVATELVTFSTLDAVSPGSLHLSSSGLSHSGSVSSLTNTTSVFQIPTTLWKKSLPALYFSYIASFVLIPSNGDSYDPSQHSHEKTPPAQVNRVRLIFWRTSQSDMCPGCSQAQGYSPNSYLFPELALQEPSTNESVYQYSSCTCGSRLPYHSVCRHRIRPHFYTSGFRLPRQHQGCCSVSTHKRHGKQQSARYLSAGE